MQMYQGSNATLTLHYSLGCTHNEYAARGRRVCSIIIAADDDQAGWRGGVASLPHLELASRRAGRAYTISSDTALVRLPVNPSHGRMDKSLLHQNEVDGEGTAALHPCGPSPSPYLFPFGFFRQGSNTPSWDGCLACSNISALTLPSPCCREAVSVVSHGHPHEPGSVQDGAFFTAPRHPRAS